ncbi:peptidylprolyl isomerase [Spiribacter onubensis]|uniref:Chaperone SurA n=1 Tax=Spiribacter onubensis TaxID=3122420 RepID=A0ABV3S5P6_9GAMM
MARPLIATLLLLLSLNIAQAQEVVLERIVALVNDDVVLASELEAELISVRQDLEQRNVRMPPAEELRRQVLERLIMQTLQLNVAERRGIRVDSATLDAAVRQVAERNGLSLTGLRDALEAQGLDMARFREQLRREIIISRLRQQVMNQRVDVTEQEIQQFIERNSSLDREYHLEQILISVPEAASANAIAEARERANAVVERLDAGESFARVAAAESDARNALEGGDMGWRPASQLPQAGADAIRELEPGQYTSPLRTPAGFQIYRLRETRGGDGQMIRQANLRHIVIETNEVVTDTDARLRLQALRERIMGGSDFADLARANSDDPTSAGDGGDLGWIDPDNLPPGFRSAVTSLEAGEVSEIFRTRGGWHIAEVVDWRERDASETIAREEAEAAIRQRKSEEETELWLRELREEAYVESRLGAAG